MRKEEGNTSLVGEESHGNLFVFIQEDRWLRSNNDIIIQFSVLLFEMIIVQWIIIVIADGPGSNDSDE